LLIENKVDLVSEEYVKNVSEIKEFTEKNKFIGFYRSSAKAGVNINESMEFLIKTIVDRMKSLSKYDEDCLMENDRRSIVLDSNKYSVGKEKSKGGGCCK